jgi:cyclopropane fatty-acyl-phospholipid synthase-like methyltransferase
MESAIVEGVTSRAIRRHYDLATPFYRLLWGPHIHHGLWDADESPGRAQQRLTEQLAAEAEIESGASVLDVGCGMGGSSIHLARRLNCRVHGLTLSPVQRWWATLSAWSQRVGSRVRFECRDAEQVRFPAESFDVLWSIECTEHLFDKPAFFRRSAEWLKPGGRVAICAWLAADRPHTSDVARDVRSVCENFLCPSLGSTSDYIGWLEDAGLAMTACHDWTHRVVRTWEICARRIRKTGVRRLAGLVGRDMSQFANHFDTIRQAFLNGAMKYGCFVARKPAGECREGV